MKVITQLLILIFFAILVGCGGREEEHPDYTVVEEQSQVMDPYYGWHPASNPSGVRYDTSTTAVPPEMRSSTSPPLRISPLPSRKRYTADDTYEEGYAEGYDQGEEDSRLRRHHGYGYDDDCDYTGRLEESYQVGYEEGYEDGYSNTFDMEEGFEEEDEYEY